MEVWYEILWEVRTGVSEKTKQLSLDQKRLRAIEYSYYASKLLEPKYFDSASKAIAEKNKEKLTKICLDAGIPEDVINRATEDIKMLNGADGWGWGGDGWGWG